MQGFAHGQGQDLDLQGLESPIRYAAASQIAYFPGTQHYLKPNNIHVRSDRFACRSNDLSGRRANWPGRLNVCLDRRIGEKPVLIPSISHTSYVIKSGKNEQGKYAAMDNRVSGINPVYKSI